MYRARLGGALDGAAAPYVTSIDDDAAILRHDVLGSMAHAIMLHDRRLVSRADAAAVLRALSGIDAAALLGGDRRGAEDVHELVEAEVTRRAGARAGGRMHTGRSRNDQVSLDIRLKLREDINGVCSLAIDLAEQLLKAARAHRRTVMPLYTHMQQAQYGTLSHYMLAHSDALMRDVERLTSAYSRIDRCPLGAAAVGGTSLNIDRRQVAALLGFGGIVENSLDATGARDHVAEYVSAIAIMMSGLSRLAEDIATWSTAEFGFVELDASVSSPSSVMPQKKNPDVLELTRGKAAASIGDLVAALAATKGLASGYSRDLQEAKLPAWAATRRATGALAVMRAAVSGMGVNAARMAEAAESGHLDAMEVAEMLVAGGDVPFREAHGAVARLVTSAHAAGSRVADLGDGEVEAALRGTSITREALSAAMSRLGSEAALRRRGSMGSAGYAEQSRMVRSRLRGLHAHRRAVALRKEAVDRAYGAVEARAAAIMGRRGGPRRGRAGAGAKASPAGRSRGQAARAP